MELGNRLTVDIYNDYAERLREFGEKLLRAGYSAEVDWDVLFEQIVSGIDKKYFPHLIRENIFNSQERILETMDKSYDWINPCSQSGFVFAKNNGTLYRYVKRWFDWLEYNENITSGKIQKHQYLLSTENGAEEQVFDINGEPILTLEGYFV